MTAGGAYEEEKEPPATHARYRSFLAAVFSSVQPACLLALSLSDH